jgi:hypothetical protein
MKTYDFYEQMAVGDRGEKVLDALTHFSVNNFIHRYLSVVYVYTQTPCIQRNFAVYTDKIRVKCGFSCIHQLNPYCTIGRAIIIIESFLKIVMVG